MPLFLTEADVAGLLTMDATLAVVESAFQDLARNQAGNHPRQRFFLPEGVLQHMAAHWVGRGVMGTKTYASYGDGTHFYVELFDARTGELLCYLEGNRLGQLRTGATTGVAARYLASEDAAIAALLGTGFQAETQAEALVKVRPGLRSLRVFGRDVVRRREFCRAMTLRLGVHFEPVDSVEAAVRGAQIVVCATSAREPILKGEWLHDDAFVAAVGANRLSAREIDEVTVERATLTVVDDVNQARVEAAELIAANERRRFFWEKLMPLSAIVSGRVKRPEHGISLFKSLGIGLEDVAAASAVYELARAQGVGRTL